MNAGAGTDFGKFVLDKSGGGAYIMLRRMERTPSAIDGSSSPIT